MGSSEKEEKTSSMGTPSDRSTTSLAVSEEKGLTLSCRTASSSLASSGRTSGLTESIWPIFMYVGPRVSMIFLACLDRGPLSSARLAPDSRIPAMRVRNGTFSRTNSPQRFLSSPGLPSQYLWIAILS